MNSSMSRFPSLRSFVPAAVLAALLPCFAAQVHAQATTNAPVQQPAAPDSKPAAAPVAQPITLPVIVVDKKGDPDKSLAAADLTLTDNGQLQNIQSFAIAQPQPTVFGLIGQTSTSLRTELGDERLAATHFIDHTLPGTDDKAFVVQFADEVDLLEDPTTAQNKLHDAITQLGTTQFGNQNGSSADAGSADDSSHHAGHGVGGTLNDAIYLASMEVMKKQPGRHVIILISDGVDRDSKESLNDAIQAAQSADTTIFAIYFKPEEQQAQPSRDTNRRGGMGGPGFPGGGGGYPGGGGGGYPGGGGGGRRGGGQPSPSAPHIDGREILEHICSATGGYMVEGRKDKADEAYAKISALLKYQYAITWVPNAAAAQFPSHHITLTSKKNDVWALVQSDFSTHP